jgi:hypothetical protein
MVKKRNSVRTNATNQQVIKKRLAFVFFQTSVVCRSSPKFVIKQQNVAL